MALYKCCIIIIIIIIETCTVSGKRGLSKVQRGWIRKLWGDPRCRGYSDGVPHGAGASGEHVVLPVASLKLNLPALTCSAGLHFTLLHGFLLLQSTDINPLQPDNWAKLQFVLGTGTGSHPRHAEYICIIVIRACQWMYRVRLTLYCSIC